MDLTQPATFDLTATIPRSEGDTVIRSGLLFRAGEYPDKEFSMTADDLRAAAARFRPCAVDLEHTDTVLDGQLGELRAVRLSDDGGELYGDVALPAWLDRLLPERKVSCTWDRATKDLMKLALVRSPRVSDAILMSAYADFAARHDTPHGQGALQDIHDMASRSGAVCAKKNAVGMASTHEASAIQQVHDKAAQHGAACHMITQTTGPARALPPSWFSSVKDNTMTIKEFFQGAKDAGVFTDEPAAAPTQTPAPAPAATFDDPRVAALEAKFKQQDEEIARLKTERIHAEAVAEVEGLIAAHKVVPAEREALIALFALAGTDDSRYGAVTFGQEEGATTSRVASLRAAYAARPAHTLTTELTPTHAGQGATFGATQTTPKAGTRPPMDEAETARLLGFMEQPVQGGSIIHAVK